MSIKRPKIASNAFARIDMTCRVCNRVMEGYAIETDDIKEPTLHDVAFQCANLMQTHLMDEHDYPKSVFAVFKTGEKK